MFESYLTILTIPVNPLYCWVLSGEVSTLSEQTPVSLTLTMNDGQKLDLSLPVKPIEPMAEMKHMKH